MAAVRPTAPRAAPSATYGFLAGRINPRARVRMPAPAAEHPQFVSAARVVLDRPDGDQFATSVVIRLGTSPTGMTALTVLLSVSMAVTDLMAALEM